MIMQLKAGVTSKNQNVGSLSIYSDIHHAFIYVCVCVFFSLCLVDLLFFLILQYCWKVLLSGATRSQLQIKFLACVSVTHDEQPCLSLRPAVVSLAK